MQSIFLKTHNFDLEINQSLNVILGSVYYLLIFEPESPSNCT